MNGTFSRIFYSSLYAFCLKKVGCIRIEITVSYLTRRRSNFCDIQTTDIRRQIFKYDTVIPLFRLTWLYNHYTGMNSHRLVSDFRVTELLLCDIIPLLLDRGCYRTMQVEFLNSNYCYVLYHEAMSLTGTGFFGFCSIHIIRLLL